MPATVKIPKSMIDPRKMSVAVTNAMNMVAKNVRVDFKVTTATWKTQVDFTIENVTPYIRRIYTVNKIYLFVCFGTKAHVIRPKRGKVLMFTTGGRPKSVPGKIKSNRGSAGKGGVVFAREVHHPGTKARNFDKVIQDKWADQFPILMQRAIDAAIQGS